MPTETQSFGIIMAPLKTSKKASDKTAVGDEPNITESQWRIYSITSAVLTCVAVLGAFACIFVDGFDPDVDLKLAQALSPFGVALFAIVTFCTACWRGSINVRQADQAEREGRAKLLQEGAKLLGERENPSHVSAGIATLEILAVGSDARLATQAMNLIADYVQLEMRATHKHRFQEQAFAALKNGEAKGRTAERDILFDTDSNKSSQELWKPIHGVRSVEYKGGSVESGLFGDFEDRREYKYKNVTLEFCDLQLDVRFHECIFHYCAIIKIDGDFKYSVKKCIFKQCDFTRCEFSNGFDLSSISGEKNYFRTGKPPTYRNGDLLDWRPFLIEGYPEN